MAATILLIFGYRYLTRHLLAPLLTLHAVANALAGKALEAADYAAYSTVYGYGSYAVNDPDSFAPEHAWQLAALTQLLREETATPQIA